MKSLNEVKDLLKQIPDCQVTENALLAEYTTFKIGGPADILVQPLTIEGLQQILMVIADKDVPYFILGKGSNILVGDLGIRGVIIRMNSLNLIKIDGTRVIAQSGVTLAKLASAALNASLTELEFASGIPGTLGGAVVMNAGAYGGEMKDVVTKVIAFTPKGEKKMLSKEEMKFSYRHSILQENNWIVAEVEMELKKRDPSEIRKIMNDLNNRRKEKQPLEYPSAGSTFKRPLGYYAGTLIEQAGLKGYSVGEAQVSEKHAGFVINKGNASASDVLRLIRHIQNQIRLMEGVEMDPEVRLVGEFDSIEE
ncbi:MAG: UDP-N-acetylmuramate dehydrogenase [Halanaerobiales bacterium]|nr:UDP-N-acetylmuramate dehydrogenase [Halanaerobiales bacterium]